MPRPRCCSASTSRCTDCHRFWAASPVAAILHIRLRLGEVLQSPVGIDRARHQRTIAVGFGGREIDPVIGGDLRQHRGARDIRPCRHMCSVGLAYGWGRNRAQPSRKVLDAALPPHGPGQSDIQKSAKDETRAYRRSLHCAGERHVVAFRLARVNDIGNGESSP